MSKKRKGKKKRSTAVTAKRRSEQHKVGFETTSLNLPEGAKLFSLKSDKAVRLDILPYIVGKGNPWADEGTLHYERTFWVHRGIGVDQSSYICLRKTCNEKCPVCEYRAKLSKDPDADEDLIKDLAPKERQLFNVIDTRDRDKGVQLWDISFHLFGKSLDARIRNADEDDGYENFAELEDGFTLKLGIEEGHYGKISFYSVETIDFKPRKEDYDEDILEEVYCLDELLNIIPYKELKQILLQTEDDDDDENEPKSKKGKKGKKGKSKKQKKDDDEFEDDDEEFEDEDDDEEFEDDDEEFEDDDEEFEDSDDDEEFEDEDDDEFEDEDDGEEFEDDDDDEEFEDDDDEDEDEPKSKKGKKGKSKKKPDKKSSKKKCPQKGTFGKDTDQIEGCRDCPIWDECDDEKHKD